MAWQTPKTNWGQPGQTVPGADDFNRIEGNIRHLQDTKETPAGAQAKAEAAAGAVQAELDAHVADNTKHVSKDGTLQSGLNADRVDGYHAGNSSGQIPVSNGTLCTNLNADKVDGEDASTLKVNARALSTAKLVAEVNSSAPASPVNGQIWYDSLNNKFKGYANGAWV